MRLKKLTLVWSLSLCWTQLMAANSIKAESLKYNIYYQWGIVWKIAAEATLTTHESTFKSQKAINLQMAAKTTPFFDHFQRVRDTLVAITSPDVQPLYYAKITHEGDYFFKEDATYSYSGAKTYIKVRGYKRTGMVSDSTLTYPKPNTVYDMLSIFHYLRNADMSKMKVNQPVPLVIVSGNEFFNIKVIYNGEMTIKTPNNINYNTQKMSIIFEYLKNNKIEKEVMEFWMSKDTRHIPIMFSVKLPLGSMKAYFDGVDE
jgi:hypothetical protein